jgi:hypothetical protein
LLLDTQNDNRHGEMEIINGFCILGNGTLHTNPFAQITYILGIVKEKSKDLEITVFEITPRVRGHLSKCSHFLISWRIADNTYNNTGNCITVQYGNSTGA